MGTKAPPIDIPQALASRGVTPNSTWLRSDNAEMYVVLPQDEDVIRELCAQYACSYTDVDATDDTPQWIRVIRLAVEGRGAPSLDVMFVPWLCGKIDHGTIKKIG